MNSKNKNSDIELIEMLQSKKKKRSDEAFNIIYSRYSSKTYGFCLYRCNSKEKAEELHQESWIKFYKSIKNGTQTTKILPYILKIINNTNINNHRDKKSKKYIKIEYIDIEKLDYFSEPIEFNNTIEKEEFLNLVKIAVQSLNDIYQEAITLYWFGDLTYKEIAAITMESEQCIRTRITRAYSQLTKLLKPYFIDDFKLKEKNNGK